MAIGGPGIALRWWHMVVLVVAVGTIAWFAGVDEQVWPKRFGVVQEGAIYRSGEPTPGATEAVVREYGIKTIIDLGAHTLDTPEERLAQRTADALGVTRYRFGLIGDATGDPNDYVLALRIMNDPAHQPVWVHCAAGSERTGCLVAMHRIVNDGEDLDAAYAETTRFDHRTRKNPHLRAMLERWADGVREAYFAGGVVEFDRVADGIGGAGRGETNGDRVGPFERLDLPEPRAFAVESADAAEPDG
ncbi:MAG: protein-tyrosine phosphatase family protein [Planctomycetota bacterium]